jgi:hypothetical protein
MKKEKKIWRLIFYVLFLLFAVVLIERFSFLLFREETNAEIVSLKKSDNESDLIVELKYKIGKETVFNTKKIKYSFYEDFKNINNVKIFYNPKFNKSIYFVDYGSSLMGDVIIIFIPTILLAYAIVGINRKRDDL